MAANGPILRNGMRERTPRDAPPTPGELRVLAAYCRAGSVKEGAYNLGLTEQTAKNALYSLYQRLRNDGVKVDGAISAAVALGWLVVPDDL